MKKFGVVLGLLSALADLGRAGSKVLPVNLFAGSDAGATIAASYRLIGKGGRAVPVHYAWWCAEATG